MHGVCIAEQRGSQKKKKKNLEMNSPTSSPGFRGVLAGRRRARSPVEVLTVRQISRMLEYVRFGHVLGSLYGVLFQLQTKSKLINLFGIR